MVNRANILHFLISARILPKKVFVDLNDLFHKDKMPLMQKPKYVTEKDGRRVYLWKRGLLENRLRLSQLGCTAAPSQQVLPSSLHISGKMNFFCKPSSLHISEKMKCICKHGKQIGMKSAKMHLRRIKATLLESSSSSTQKI